VPTAGPNIVKAAAKKKYDYLVVGAGFAGSVIAERLASQLGAHVLSSTSGRTSPATPTTISTRPAC
jgi:choline dehydrogenase-like flavoprotein